MDCNGKCSHFFPQPPGGAGSCVGPVGLQVPSPASLSHMSTWFSSLPHGHSVSVEENRNRYEVDALKQAQGVSGINSYFTGQDLEMSAS